MYQFNPLLESLDKKDKAELLGTGVGVHAGRKFLGSSYDDLMGTVTRYHNTSAANVDSIKEKGILGKFAADPNNITNKVLHDVPMKDKEGLVYLGRGKDIGRSVGMNRAIRGVDPAVNAAAFKKNPLKAALAFGGKDIKVRMNLDDWEKLAKVDNPELRGAKSVKDFYQKVKKANGGLFMPDWEKLDPLQKSMVNSSYKSLGKGTDVVKGNISPEHIIGSKHYKKATDAKRWAKYVKEHPGRFGKGVAKATAGIGSLAAAAYLGKKFYDKKHAEKLAKEAEG